MYHQGIYQGIIISVLYSEKKYRKSVYRMRHRLPNIAMLLGRVRGRHMTADVLQLRQLRQSDDDVMLLQLVPW